MIKEEIIDASYSLNDLKIIKQVLRNKIIETKNYCYIQELTSLLEKTELQIKKRSLKFLKGGR